jgi:hypothetical protein
MNCFSVLVRPETQFVDWRNRHNAAHRSWFRQISEHRSAVVRIHHRPGPEVGKASNFLRIRVPGTGGEGNALSATTSDWLANIEMANKVEMTFVFRCE